MTQLTLGVKDFRIGTGDLVRVIRSREGALVKDTIAVVACVHPVQKNKYHLVGVGHHSFSKENLEVLAYVRTSVTLKSIKFTSHHRNIFGEYAQDRVVSR